MSRSGYSDLETWSMIRWRGAVKAAIRGKRGQAFLRELLEALDALPTKRLVAHSFQQVDGEVCALGSVGLKRGTDMSGFITKDECGDEEVDGDVVGDSFGISRAMAKEIMYENDESAWHETPEQRFARVRAWVVREIIVAKP